MRIIEIEMLENGGHRNQNSNYTFVPEGWAVIPEDMETPNFPFGNITVEEIDGVPTVTQWEAGKFPEPKPEPKTEPTTEELLNIILGVNE
jgi:hypothetical protein